MSLLQALVLALVQGITEFLPISSTAHLILLPALMGWPEHSLTFDVAVNTGTMLAVMAYFRRDLWGLVTGTIRGEGEVEGVEPRFLAALLALGTVPVAAFGLAASDWVEGAARQPWIVAAASIVFGLALALADALGVRRRTVAGLTWTDALWIGLAQAIALVPGTSRSGITVTAALALGFSRPAAARFSFLLAIPVGILAAGYDLLKVATGGVPAGDLLPMALATVVAGVSAYLVIGWLLAWLERQTMTVFVVYRVALGLAILAVLG